MACHSLRALLEDVYEVRAYNNARAEVAPTPSLTSPELEIDVRDVPRTLTNLCYYALSEQEKAAIAGPSYKADEGAPGGGVAAHVYGDTDVELIRYLVEDETCAGHKISPADVFADLGSGSGKLVLSMQLVTDVRRSEGVELSHTRHEIAQEAKKRVLERIGHRTGGTAGQQHSIEFFQGNMLEHDLSETTILFCYTLCFDESFLWRLASRFLATMPAGALILLRGKQLPTDALYGGCGGGGESGGSSLSCQRQEKTRFLHPLFSTKILNRVWQYHVYRVVSTSSMSAATIEMCVLTPPRTVELEQQSVTVNVTIGPEEAPGSTQSLAVEYAVLGPPAPVDELEKRFGEETWRIFEEDGITESVGQ